MGLLVNQEAFDELPPAYQEILRAACGDTAVDRLAIYDVEEPKALTRLTNDHGVILRQYSEDILAAAWRESNAYLEEQAAADDTFRRVYESWRDFRALAFPYAIQSEVGYQAFTFEKSGNSA